MKVRLFHLIYSCTNPISSKNIGQKLCTMKFWEIMLQSGFSQSDSKIFKSTILLKKIMKLANFCLSIENLKFIKIFWVGLL